MACKPNARLQSPFIVITILLAMTQLINAGRQVPNNAKKPSTRQGEWFIGRDGSITIPGFGRYTAPPFFSGGGDGSTTPPFSSGGGDGSTTTPFSSGGGDHSTTPPFSSGGGDGSTTPPFSSGGGDDSATPPFSSGGGDDSAAPPFSSGSGYSSTTPPYSHGGDSGIAPSDSFHTQIPGVDDTFIPNPGYEVPIPHGHKQIAAVHH